MGNTDFFHVYKKNQPRKIIKKMSCVRSPVTCDLPCLVYFLRYVSYNCVSSRGWRAAHTTTDISTH